MSSLSGIAMPTWDTASCQSLEQRIGALWHDVENGIQVDATVAKADVLSALEALSCGALPIVQPPINASDPWIVNAVMKQAILLAFRFFPAEQQSSLPFWWDKIGLLQDQWARWSAQGIRIVPGAFVRQGVYLGPSCIVMPSFINIGAWIGQGTMIDCGANIGSCAYIGHRCHISANVTVGGVLEPVQATPVIIEDHVFIGAGCHVVEGVHIGQGSILASGVILTSSTKVIVRETGQAISGRIPPYSVLIPGSYSTGVHGLSIQCAILAKTTEPGLSPKTALNEILRLM